MKLIYPIGLIYTKVFNIIINHAIDILILIRNYNMYGIWSHVIQSILKLHTVMFSKCNAAVR